jgi:hypothetical protein
MGSERISELGLAGIAAAVRSGAEAAVAEAHAASAPAACEHIALGTLTLRLPHDTGPRALAEAVEAAIARRLR